MAAHRSLTVIFLITLCMTALACSLFSVTVRGGVTTTAIVITNPGAAMGAAQTAAAQALTQVALTPLPITPVESAFAPGNPTQIPPEWLTGTPPAFGVQPEAIQIIVPAIGATVTSPVHVAGEANPTFEQNLVVQVADADGRVIATLPTTIQANAGERGPFFVDVLFAVDSEQPGRISVYATSARDGGIIHLSSVEVTLKP